MYRIDYDRFYERFFLGGKFRHISLSDKSRFRIFPYSSNTETKNILNSFDGILGPFIRAVFGWKRPKAIDRETFLDKICENVSFPSTQDKTALLSIIQDIYFENETRLVCNNVDTYKYAVGTTTDQNVSEYLVSALCDRESVKAALGRQRNTNISLLDKLVIENLPELEVDDKLTSYASLFPEIKKLFTKDFEFLAKKDDTDFSSIILLLSYYYFFYTSQVMLHLNRFCSMDRNITKLYFCVQWEKVSRNREAFKNGWKTIEDKATGMFSHAVLLEMLNQTDSETLYCYDDLLNEYNSLPDEEKAQMFAEIENLKNRYRTGCANSDGFGFSYEENNYRQGDIGSLIRGFFDDIMLQFMNTERKRANDAYPKSFMDFCKNVFVQRRGQAGNVLAMTEEQLVLMTKVTIGDNDKMRLNDLFKGFEQRGLFFDNSSKDCIVEFYEKLNLIEKKSDSGDAQYVKSLL